MNKNRWLTITITHETNNKLKELRDELSKELNITKISLNDVINKLIRDNEK